MDGVRLVGGGLVGILAGRGWRAYAGPLAFLVAATVAIGLLRGHLGGHSASSPPPAATAVRHAKAKPGRHNARKFYVVRAGDTIEAIASRMGTTTAQILRLNPTVSPTALFIGEKIRLR